MRAFRAQFFVALEDLPWWWEASPLRKMVFLQLFRVACEYGGEVWIGIRGLTTYLGPEVTPDDVRESYEWLAAKGALVDVSSPSQRWAYRIEGFEKLADAVDTYRARARANYRRMRAKRGPQEVPA